MKIDFKIQAFLVEPKPTIKLTDDISTWGETENLYIVTEPVEIADELVREIIDEQKMQASPQVYLKYLDGGYKWSELKSIHHQKEVEHRMRFKNRLVASDRFSDEKIKELTSRFFIMLYPAHHIWFQLHPIEMPQEILDCWSNIQDRLYNEVDGKIHFTGFTQFDGVFDKDEYIPAWQYISELTDSHYEIRPDTQVIDADAFKLWDIEQITIPESVEEIVGNPFGDSKYQKKCISNIISYSPRFIAENGILYEKLDDETKRLIYCYDKSIKMVEDPDVSIIETKTFKDCSFLQDISFPNAKVIKGKAFQNCTGLINVEFGSDAFFDESIAGTFDCPLILHEKAQFKSV